MASQVLERKIVLLFTYRKIVIIFNSVELEHTPSSFPQSKSWWAIVQSKKKSQLSSEKSCFLAHNGITTLKTTREGQESTTKTRLHLAWPPKFKNQALFTPRAQNRFLFLDYFYVVAGRNLDPCLPAWKSFSPWYPRVQRSGLLLRGLLWRGYTGVKVIRVEVSQNVVSLHARTTGWMTYTRAGKGQDFGLQPRRSNPRRGTCFELSEWKALGSWTLGQAKCNLVFVVDSWPSLVVFEVWSRLWANSKKHELSDESWLFFFFFFFFFDRTMADHLFHCGKLDGVCSSSIDLKIITIFWYMKWSTIFLFNTSDAIVKKKKKKKEKRLSIARTMIDPERYRLLSAGNSGNGLLCISTSFFNCYIKRSVHMTRAGFYAVTLAPRGEIESVRTHSEVIVQFDSFSLLKLLFLVRNWHCWSRKAFTRQMTPQSREKTAKKAAFFDTAGRHAKLYDRGCTPAPKDATKLAVFFRFFESFLWHFNKKQRAKVIFSLSRPVRVKKIRKKALGSNDLSTLPSIVSGSGYKEDVAPLLKELMIDPIEHRWAQHVAVTTFRCRHGTAPPDLRKKLKSVDHRRTTRGASGNYVPYRSSSTSGTVSFSNRAPLIWNSLPNELQEAGSVNCFKRLYLKLLSDPHSANALDLAINCPHY